MILQIFLILFWLGLVPFCTGLCPAAMLKKEHRSFGTIYLTGYLVNLALFQCVYLVFFLAKISFFILWPTVGVLSVLAAIVSVIFGYDVFMKMEKRKPGIGFFIFLAVVLLQFVMRFRNGVTDGDDAYYLSTALTTYQSGTMYILNGYTGYAVKDLSDIRHALAGLPVWLAAFAKLTHTHPTALAHTAVALQVLSVHYIIIWEIGWRLLKKTPRFVPMFAIFVAIFNIYGNVSLYTSQTFLLTRTWQGKTIFGNIFIPFVFLILFMLADFQVKERGSLGTYIVLSIGMLAASTATTGAVFMLPILLAIGSICMGITCKKYLLPVYCALSLIPLGGVGLLYVLLR